MQSDVNRSRYSSKPYRARTHVVSLRVALTTLFHHLFQASLGNMYYEACWVGLIVSKP